MLIKTQLPRVLTRVILIQIKVPTIQLFKVHNNNSANPADIFNRDNPNEFSQIPTFALTKILPLHHLCCMADPKLSPSRM